VTYDPYAAGVTSDPTWAQRGYAMLGVNFRGTGCSQGTFQPLRSDVWGGDGARVVDWAAHQSWSDGNVGMFGFSFGGTSQIATAEHAGPALKAIAPENVFPDIYGDMVYPGGIDNAWIAGWVGLGRQFVVGAAAVEYAPSDAGCMGNIAHQAAPNEAQTGDVALHPYRDDFWATAPAAGIGRLHVPVLGCVNWQDTTVYSHAFDAFRTEFDPRLTWLTGGDGAHTDCPISRAEEVAFFDHYLRHADNGWPATPHVELAHEVPTSYPGQGDVPDGVARWTTGFQTWAAMERAIRPVRLYLRAGGRMAGEPATANESPDSYAYGLPSANTPADWTGQSAWNDPQAAAGEATYTTPVLAHDAEFLGSGSANLWMASSAPDTDVQITLSEIRPDGQEQFVENGWLRLSHRRLDRRRSTALLPVHTDRQADARPLSPGVPAYVRVQLEPFDHVFRAGSAIRLSIDTPGHWFAALPGPATDQVFHSSGMPSALVLGLVANGAAQAPRPSCAAMLNQPCRAVSGTVPSGQLTLRGQTKGSRKSRGRRAFR
jgi:putative CocE/NonD family hydrolase